MRIQTILSPEEISEILTHGVVTTNKERLASQNVVKFSIALSASLKAKLEYSLSIDVSNVTHIPMRWIRGDTAPHIDRGESSFTNTYLIYLTDSEGNLVIDGTSYSITAGDAHIFHEGLEHSTINTGNTERLMIGPMSESGFPVGSPTIYYYSDVSNNRFISYGYDTKGYDAYGNDVFDYGPPISITIYGPTPAFPNDLSENFPNDPSANYRNVSETPPDFTPPPGKVFGGWILASVEPFTNTPITVGLSDEHIYMPGETYIYNNSENHSLVPNWIDVPISNICFPANTPITTDQGIITIETIRPHMHTIRGKTIVAITQTVSRSNYLVCFEKHAISTNVPSERTVVSNNHLIFHKGKMMKAEDFLGKYTNIYKTAYTNEILYNVLLQEYDTILVNNLVCETLHPDNMIAKLYTLLPNYTGEQQRQIIAKYNARINRYYDTRASNSRQ